MKFKVLSLCAAIIFSSFCIAEEKITVKKNTSPEKICILITDVGTIDTVAKTEEFLQKIKQFNIESAPKMSDADKAADPSIRKKEINFRFNDSVKRYNEAEREIAAQNRRMGKILENLRTSIIGNENKRDIVVAKQYLQSYLSKYSDFIQIIDRSNTNIAEVEKAINGNSQQDIASACFFLTVIMQDMKSESSTVAIGNTTIKKTTYTQKAVGNLRDFNGNVITAFNVAAQTSRRQTSASAQQGYSPSSDLMEAVLKEISNKIADFYLCNLNIKCIGPKDDEDFDEDTVTFTVDGKEFDNGNKILSGSHTIVAECDGYQTVKKTIQVKRGRPKMITKIKFKKAAATQ